MNSNFIDLKDNPPKKKNWNNFISNKKIFFFFFNEKNLPFFRSACKLISIETNNMRAQRFTFANIFITKFAKNK